MARRTNETIPLLVALVVTAACLGGGGWWLLQQQKQPQASGPSGSAASGQPTTNSSASSPLPPQIAASNPTPSAPSSLPAAADPPQGTFNYGGSTTWAPIRAEVDPTLLASTADFQLRYVDPVSGSPGSGRGIQMLLDGQLSFSQSSRGLKVEEIQTAEAKGYRLKEVAVALDAIAIAVNPALDIPGLTVSQLKDIYTGKITNWDRVGGPDLTIAPYTRDLADGGTVEFFVSNILEDAPFGSTVETVYSTTPGLRAVADNPGGIYYASAPEVVPQCAVKTIAIGRTADRLVSLHREPRIDPAQCPAQRNAINIPALAEGTYPFSRRLFVIVKMDGGPDQQAGQAYADLLLSPEGQKAIADAGFVPIR
ncbi:ABC-type phosphate transport system, periplasmic component [Rubidibacter lacunae KORDI 51-2]|uniref:ABC-type phosphate transport system, periplasmic component n=1 Tax=Rubidibacter lacunae KORDI 51-2 TaxID=582515 RepID=U5D5P3_9CHRO|nr:PstS family phosphate ABC transporter substrate-binding protein [Rubidibacter lacunae]ERN39988.1 ABC-type phosphate transport system, periplasmic component [Rubidibacter lacunae KORDI 51-2]